MSSIWKREVASYYQGVVGWLLAAFLLLFVGIYGMAYNLSGYTARFELVLSAVSFIYLIAVPIISMRSLAEEKRQKTDQLLYSLPITTLDIVLGKFFAMLTILAMPLAIVCFYPLILSQYGAVRLQTAYSSLLAFFLLGASCLSIGLFISSITESQVASAVITLVVMLLLYVARGLAGFLSTESLPSLIALLVVAALAAVVVQILAKNPILTVLVFGGFFAVLFFLYQNNPTFFSGLFPKIVSALGLFDRFEPFVNGILDLTAVVYYLSITVFFLFLSVQSMEKRRWNE